MRNTVQPKKLGWVITLLGLVITPTLADTTYNEYRQKAKIIKYVLQTTNWPENTLIGNTLQICVAGDSQAMKPFKSLDGTIIKQHRIQVKKILDPLKLTENCQLIYLDELQAPDVKAIIATFAQKPILLLADIQNFAKQGGTMNFIAINDALGLTINMEALKNSNLTMDRHAYSHLTIVPEKTELSN